MARASRASITTQECPVRHEFTHCPQQQGSIALARLSIAVTEKQFNLAMSNERPIPGLNSKFPANIVFEGRFGFFLGFLSQHQSVAVRGASDD